MLPLSFIRENKDFIKKGLTKRNLSNINIIDQVIELDQNRRSIMLKLENILSNTNKINKDIGLSIKSGKKENIDSLKSKSSKLKSDAKIDAKNKKKTNGRNMLKNIQKHFKKISFCRFFDVTLVSKSKKKRVENRKQMKLFGEPGLKAIFHRFGIDSQVILGAKIVKINEESLKM